jgi:hypothetical protein
VAYAREQVVLDASVDDPNKLTPGEKYPAGKGWMEVTEFASDQMLPPKPEPAAIPRPKKEEFVDPEYIDYAAPNGLIYQQGPVVEAEPGTPDVESYDGIKEREEAKKAEQEAAAQEALAAQQAAAGEEEVTDPYQYPEIRDVPDTTSTGRINFDPSTLSGADAHILTLALHNTVVPEYNIPHPPLKEKMSREQYEAEIEAERQKAIMADESVDARIQQSRDKLYGDFAEKTMKEQLAKQRAEQANSDDEKYLTPVIVDKHGHPVEDIRQFYGGFPGAPLSSPQAFPTAPDYLPHDPQQEYFKRLLAEQELESDGQGTVQQEQQELAAADEASEGGESEIVKEEEEAEQAAQQSEQQQQGQEQQLPVQQQQQQQLPVQQQQQQQIQKEQEQSIEEDTQEIPPQQQQQQAQQQLSQQEQVPEEQTEESATQAITELKDEIMSLGERVRAIEDKESGVVPPQQQQQVAQQQQQQQAAEVPEESQEAVHEQQVEADQEANEEAAEAANQQQDQAAEEVNAEEPLAQQQEPLAEKEEEEAQVAQQQQIPEEQSEEQSEEETEETPLAESDAPETPQEVQQENALPPQQQQAVAQQQQQQAVPQEPLAAEAEAAAQQEAVAEEQNPAEAEKVDLESALVATKETEKFLMKLMELKQSVRRRM